MLRDDHYQRQHVVTTADRHGFLEKLIGGIVFSVPVGDKEDDCSYGRLGGDGRSLLRGQRRRSTVVSAVYFNLC